MILTLPYPPSVNTYWRNFRGRMVIGQKGRDYRIAVSRALSALNIVGMGSARLAVTIKAWMPDKRKRDVDNVLKATLDSLMHAGLYDDDGQIDDLRVIRAGVESPGRIDVEIEELR